MSAPGLAAHIPWLVTTVSCTRSETVPHSGRPPRPGEAAVEGQFPGAPVPADQQVPVPGPESLMVTMPSRTIGVLWRRPLRTTAARAAGQPRGELTGAGGMPGHGRYPVIAGDWEHVGDALGFQPGAQRPVILVHLVVGDPGEQHRSGDGPRDHPPGKLRFSREPDVTGNPAAAQRSSLPAQDPGR